MSVRVVFMGSPEFSVPTLRGLAERYNVVGVVTQPDRPAGRGRVLTPPPIKVLAHSLGIEVIQPERLREPEAQARLAAWAPDLIVVTAFGQILRKSVLELPRYGCVNVHASLLPRWRGAAPIQAAILHGDEQTGATIMIMDPGVDTGPTLAQAALEIRPDDTAETLGARLSQGGVDLLLRTLPGYLDGAILPQPQDSEQATYAPMLKKEEGLLDFSQPAAALERRVRAFNPWPGAFLDWQGQPLKVHRAHVHNCAGDLVVAGKRCIADGLPGIQTINDCLVLDEVQPAGKRAMPGRDFLRGAQHWAED
jgi:methionyl-tRNA formyltransferase